MRCADLAPAACPSGPAMSAVSAEPPKARRSRSIDHVPPDAEPLGHPPRGLELDRVPLAVAHAQGVHVEAVALRDGGGGGRVHAAAQEHHGLGSVIRER